MPRTLIVVAGAGLTISFICLGLATALGGDDLKNAPFGGWFFNSCASNEGEKAAGNSREFAWDGSDKVIINVPAVVRYRPDGGPNVIASGPSELLSHLRVGNGQIALDCWGSYGRFDLTLPGKPMERFTLNGSANLELENLDQRELKIEIRGSGRVRATGTAKDVDVRIAGSGDAHLGDLAVENIDIRIAGSGDAEVAPKEQADIRIAGSGTIRLLTQPRTLNTRIAGAGRIINAPSASASPR